MLRSRPTTLSITTTELKDFELRSRYRKYLRSTGEAPANGKAPVRVPKGPFDDRLVLPRPRDADHDASPDGSDLEADLLLDFDPMRASSTREETGIDLHVESAVDLAQESPSESERAQLLERGDDETGQPETARQQILRPGPARDPAVVLPPPFSSRPRALTAVDSPTLEADTTVPGLDGCGASDIDELTLRFDDHLVLDTRTAQAASSARPRDRGRQRSMSDGVGPSDRLDVTIYDDGVSPDQQPQTPRHLAESRHQSQVDGSQTASVSSRTRLGLSQATATAGGSPRRGKWKEPAVEEREF